jgi:CBS-domain-containing membrane protein
VIKLFALIPSESRFESVRWVAAALSTAIAIIVMAVTETTHPPAGATALLPAIDDAVFQLGWYYLPVLLLSSSIMLVSALLVNNLQRRYPVYWITPVKPAILHPKVDEEKGVKVGEEADGGSQRVSEGSTVAEG